MLMRFKKNLDQLLHMWRDYSMPHKKELLRIEKENQEKIQRITEKFEILEGAL